MTRVGSLRHSKKKKAIIVNLSKPAGHVMHQQIEYSTTLRSANTVYLCVLYLSENKQRLVPLTA